MISQLRATGTHTIINPDVVPIVTFRVTCSGECHHGARILRIEHQGEIIVAAVVAVRTAVVVDNRTAGGQRVAAGGAHDVLAGRGGHGTCPFAAAAALDIDVVGGGGNQVRQRVGVVGHTNSDGAFTLFRIESGSAVGDIPRSGSAVLGPSDRDIVVAHIGDR